MSNTIDSRVVEMRFDNQQFESNVKTSMSTLDKLKSALRLDGVSKGLESVNDAAKKVNFNPLGDGVEAVKVKFSALQVMAVTALQNITNSAINAGKNLVKAFTLDPVMSGFQEYETQINAVQTILANTQHNGTTLDEVNAALDELNQYADQTIYNFTEMTRNIGTFTAAGVDLQTSVDSIKGIANLAAVSGSTSQQASTAMYQLSQALAAGKVSLMDWNSVVNAGMGGKVFQDALVRTSELLGTGAKAAIDGYGSFRESLTKGEWLTTEVLTETLKQFAGAYTEAELIQQGFTEEQAKEIATMANTAEEAATKVKTFTQLMDTLKEAAQSGWTQSWEIIIGDFEEAKEMWSEVSDFFGAIIQKISDARNNILEGSFGRTFTKLAETINGISEPIKNVTKPIKEVGESLENLDEIANRVISGEFGYMQERWDKLTEAGYDWIDVQNKVNEKLGISYRHTKDVTDAQGKQMESTEAQTDAQSDLNESQKNNIELLTELSYSQLRSMGYTEKQIGALYELKVLSEKTGIPIKELIDNLDKLSGRWLALEGIKNIGKAIINVFSTIKDAWVDVFKPLNEVQKANKLFDAIAGFHKLSREIKEFTENSKNIEKITRTFKGLFSALDIIKKVLSAGLTVAIKIVSGVLDRFGLSILDVTAYIGDAITSFHDWLVENELITEVFEKVIDVIANVITTVKEWIDAFLEIPQVSYLIENFGSITRGIFNDLSEYFKGGIDAFLDFIDRVKQLDGLTLENVKIAVKDFCENVIGYFFDFNGHFKSLKKWLGVLGKAFETFLNEKVTGPFKTAIDALKTFKDKVVTIFENIGTKIRDNVGMGEILTMLLGGSLVYGMAKLGSIASTFESLIDIFKDFGGVAKHFNGVLDAVKGTIKGFSLSIKAKAILTIAAAIAVLAGSIWLLCAKTSPGEMWSAVGAIAALGLVLSGISFALSKIEFDSGKGLAVAIAAIIALSASIGILVLAMKGLDTLNPDNLGRNIGIIAGMLVALSGLAIAISKFTKFESGLASGVLVLIGIALLIKMLVNAFIELDSMELENMEQTADIIANVLVGISLLALALGGAGRLCKGSTAGAGIGILAMVAAIYLMIGAFVKIDSLKIENVKGLIIKLAGILVALAALSLILKFAGENMLQAGVGILAMVAAMYLLAGLIKIITSIEGNIEPALSCITDILWLFAIITLASNFAGKNAAKAGVMLLLMAGAIAILTGIMIIIGSLEQEQIDKGITAITSIMAMFGLILVASFFASQIKLGPMIALAVSLGILLAAVGALSMIETEALYSAVGAITVVLMAFAVIMLASEQVKGAMSTMIVMTVAIGILGGLLIALSILNPEGMLPAAIALGALMLALAAAMYIIGGVSGNMIAGAGAMIMISAALIILAGALVLLQNVSWEGMLNGFGALCLAILGLVATLVIMEAFALGAAILVGVVIGMSVALLITGVAALAFAGAIAIVTACLPGLGEGLTAVGTGLSNFITSVAACRDDSTAFAEVMSQVGTSVASCLVKIAGGMTLAGLAAIVLGAGLVVAAVGVIAASAAIIVLSVAIIALAAAFTLSFKMIYDLFVSIGETAKDAGNNVVAGFANGITEKLDSIKEAGKALVDGVKNTICDLLGIHSPSTEAYAWGDYTGQGYANGLTDSTPKAESAAEGLIDGVKNCFADDTSISETTNAEGSKAGSNFNSGLGDSLDIGSVLGGEMSGLDMSQFSGLMSGDGSEAGSSFNLGLGDSLDISSVMGGEMSGLDMSQFSSMMNSDGSEAGSSFNLGLGDGLDIGSTMNGEMAGTDMSQVNASMSSSGSEAGNSFSTGFINGVDTSGINSMLDSIIATIKSKSSEFEAAGKSVSLAYSNAINKSITIVSTGSFRIFAVFNSMMAKASSIVNAGSLKISAMFRNMMTITTVTIMTSGTKIINAFKMIVMNSLKYITSSIPKFNSAGIKLTMMFATGISKSSAIVKRSISIMLASCISTFTMYYYPFYNTGAYLVKGFASGIERNTYIAEAKSRAMAEKALDAARDILDINSPSKEFFKIGKYVDEGFANGITNSEGKVINSISSISDGVIANASNIITGIDEAMRNKSISSPTISPVIDMDNVNTENLKVSSMLDAIVSDPVESLSNLMANIQSGIEKSNEKVATIINGLREDINTLYSDDNDKEIALYVDSKKLATSMAKPMNRQLNILARREG